MNHGSNFKRVPSVCVTCYWPYMSPLTYELQAADCWMLKGGGTASFILMFEGCW